MAPYKIIKQGYIMKEPPASKRGLRRKLHRYWFVLVEDPQQVALVYFKNEDAYIARQRNEGFIRVDNSISINVISEHLGCKNAFVIKSIRTDYTLVPESRYDLHEWLFTLHNSIEAFKTRQKKAEERRRMPIRLRANTVESITVPPPPAPTSEGGSIRTITPTRRAPPAPPAGATGRTSSSARRKPVRPAPAAPGPRRTRSHSQSQMMSPTSSLPPAMTAPMDIGQESPPPAYSDTSSGTPVHSFEARGDGRSPGMFDMGIHPVMELNISSEAGQDEFHRQFSLPQRHKERTQPDRPQSAPETLLLMHKNSASLPDLINCEVTGGAMVGVAAGGVASEDRGAIHHQRSMSETRHTRHLSLIGNEDILAKRPPRDRKKRSARRNGSIKLRSRSPPNLPPPPPPPSMGELQEDGEETTDRGLEVGRDKQRRDTIGPPLVTNGLNSDLTSQSSSTSVGFSEVMNTISNIDHELDEIEASPVKPSVPAPRRNMVHTTAQAKGPPEFTVGTVNDNFNEEEWLCDVSDEATPLSPPNRPTPEGGPQSAEEEESETEASPTASRDSRYGKKKDDGFVPAQQLVSSGFIPAAAIEQSTQPTSDLQAKPAKGKHRVMFKEEVEDIPNNYEPRVDQEVDANEDEDEIPTGVAALKRKLFGEKEKETTKYKREGVLSPKYTHPVNMNFEPGYKFDQESSPFYHDSSPNVNNNNGSEGEQATPKLAANQPQDEPNVGGATAAVTTASMASARLPEQKPKRKQEGLYETPWEMSSKYKVIGRMRAGSAGMAGKPATKERTPPPVSPKTKKGIQFGEVSVTETPVPGSSEIRNVHSLERSKYRKERIQRQEQSRSLDRPAHHEPSPVSPNQSNSLDRPGNKVQSPPHTLAFSPSAPVAKDDEDDLLASITDTLQKQSKYGSITLLSPPSASPHVPTSVADQPSSQTRKVQSEVRRSSRSELEKIRAAHRREPPPPPMGVGPVVTTPTRTSSQGSSPAHQQGTPQRSNAAAAIRTSPLGNFTSPSANSRTSPQGPITVPAAMRSSPPNLHGPTVAQPTLSFAQQTRQSPNHSSPKQAPHHSSQILTSPAHRSGGQGKRRMFSGRPRMATSLDELQTNPMTQVTYDANSKSHIFRSLV